MYAQDVRSRITDDLGPVTYVAVEKWGVWGRVGECGGVCVECVWRVGRRLRSGAEKQIGNFPLGGVKMIYLVAKSNSTNKHSACAFKCIQLGIMMGCRLQVITLKGIQMSPNTKYE